MKWTLMLALAQCCLALAFQGPHFQVSSPVDPGALVLSSPFGPRLKASENFRYDFHRGIDIPGDLEQPTYAVAAGTIYNAYPDGSPNYPSSGNVVVVEHAVAQPFLFHGFMVDHYYALYLHLNSFGPAATLALGGALDVPIAEGELVGGMGQTGDSTFTHLHFEIRLQTLCSLPFQLANPLLQCAQYGFDPHVNFLTEYLDPVDPNLFSINLEPDGITDFRASITAPPEALIVDGLSIEVETLSGDPVYERQVSFENRTSFDPSSVASLDDPDLGGLLVLPAAFSTANDAYQIDYSFHLPPEVWVGQSQLVLRCNLLTTQGIIQSAELNIACVAIPLDSWNRVPEEPEWDVDGNGIVSLLDYVAMFGCLP